jgi:hypothetical protein
MKEAQMTVPKHLSRRGPGAAFHLVPGLLLAITLPGQETTEPAKSPQPQARPALAADPAGASRPRLGAGWLLEGLAEKDTELTIGGYFDLEYRDAGDSNRRFRVHRLVPLFEGRIGQRLSFQAEIEIEDGGDLAIEFAHLDYRLFDGLALRGGVLLLPLGKLNAVHDSPIQELTDRPLVDTFVIPTTLRDAGFGLHGSHSLWESGPEFTGEAYVHSGFRGQAANGSYLLNRTTGLKDARPHKSTGGYDPYEDNNNSFAFTGRMAARNPGWEAGLSLHAGTWDNNGDLSQTIGAVDLTFSPAVFSCLREGPLSFLADQEILFEGALGSIERDAAARTGGVPGEVGGWYVQWSQKIYPAFLRAGDSPFFDDGGRLTLVLRHGRVDLDGARLERSVLGFNVRPNQDRTVLKFELQSNREGGLAPGKRNDAFVFSIATYF